MAPCQIKRGGGSFVLRCTAGQHVLFAHASRCMHAARCIGRRRGAPAEAAADLLWSCGCMLHPALPENFLHLARIFVWGELYQFLLSTRRGGGAYPPWDFLGFRKRVACCSARAHEKKRGISQLFFRRRIAFALISTKRAGRFSSWIPGRQPAKKVRKVPAAQRPRSATA